MIHYTKGLQTNKKFMLTMFWKEKTSRSDSDGEKSQVVGAAGLLVSGTV